MKNGDHWRQQPSLVLRRLCSTPGGGRAELVPGGAYPCRPPPGCAASGYPASVPDADARTSRRGRLLDGLGSIERRTVIECQALPGLHRPSHGGHGPSVSGGRARTRSTDASATGTQREATGEESFRRSGQKRRALRWTSGSFPSQRGLTCRQRGLSARVGGPCHAGWALNCYTLKDIARQMHTTINQLMKTKLRTAHSRPSTSAAAFTSPHGGPIFSTSTNHSYRHGLKVFEVYVCRSPR